VNKVLVTGGAGFLGSSIVRELLDRRLSVRVLALPKETTENVGGLDVEIVRGNVLDIPSVTRAVEGVDAVFHAAAVYKDFMPDPTPMYDANLRGTFNVLEASRRGGVSKIVYTASIVALGRPRPGELGDENTPYDGWAIDFAYGRSKYHSRILAEDFANWGLDVRVVCPGVVLGPRDVVPTPSGKLVINAAKTRFAFYTDGGASYVDVRDAAAVHVLAAEKGRAGERYLAVGHNLSNRDLVEKVFDALGRKPRATKMPYKLARRAIRALEKRAIRIGVEPPIAAPMFEYTEKPCYYSNLKARTELGARFRPIDETLRDSVDYFRSRGLVER
jgi:dihydroflavonol-4-reductase